MSKSFDIKDLGPAQYILGTKICNERCRRKLWISQEQYIKWILQKFKIKNSKSVSTHLAAHLKLSTKQSSSTEKEKELMKNIPYISAIIGIIYSMVYTRTDLVHAIGIVSRFLVNPGKEHWNTVILEYLKGTCSSIYVLAVVNLLWKVT